MKITLIKNGEKVGELNQEKLPKPGSLVDGPGGPYVVARVVARNANEGAAFVKDYKF